MLTASLEMKRTANNTSMTKLRDIFLKCAVVTFLCCLLVTISASQNADQSAPEPSTGESSSAQPSTGQSPLEQPSATQPSPEKKISPAEADKLFRSVDEILQFASKDTGLPIKAKVKRRLVSRDEVEAYLKKNMQDDQDAKRLQRSELVLKKFGLLPRQFDLRTFLLALLKEQVAGYYDPKTKTVNLLDWLPAEQQRPVLAHELTHALQDQSFNLDKWMRPDQDLDAKKQITWADIVEDESSETRQAVVEGQAMAVLVDYMLQPLGQSLLTAPQVVAGMKTQMLAGSPDSVEFGHAPMFMKQALTFPYSYGLDFVVRLLAAGGKTRAYAGAFTDPPWITRQIMEPQIYLSGQQLPPMALPDFNHVFKDYDRFDLGAIGEFDVSMLLAQYVNLDVAGELAPHWRGGYYYSAYPKHKPNSPLGLLYVSRWSSPETAQQFAAIYAKALPQRYKQVQADPQDSSAVDLTTLQHLTGIHHWSTEEGPVVISVDGDTVMASESLSDAVTQEMQHELATAPASPH